jgi:hypothetical protein
VSATESGSGSCDQTLSSGKTISINYTVSKSGVSLSTSSSNFTAIASDNAAKAKNGATSLGSSMQTNQGGTASGKVPEKIGDKVSNVLPNQKKPYADDDVGKEALKRTHVVAYLFSAFGQTFTQFQWYTRDQMIGLTEETGNEYRAAFSERIDKDESVTNTRYGAIIQTVDSPIVSIAPERLTQNGWKYREGFDMHTHGKVGPRYKATALDVAYLRQTPAAGRVALGERMNPRFGGVRTDFSSQDKVGQQQGWLATPDGIRHGYRDTREVWRNEDLIRPTTKAGP